MITAAMGSERLLCIGSWRQCPVFAVGSYVLRISNYQMTPGSVVYLHTSPQVTSEPFIWLEKCTVLRSIASQRLNAKAQASLHCIWLFLSRHVLDLGVVIMTPEEPLVARKCISSTKTPTTKTCVWLVFLVTSRMQHQVQLVCE